MMWGGGPSRPREPSLEGPIDTLVLGERVEVLGELGVCEWGWKGEDRGDGRGWLGRRGGSWAAGGDEMRKCARR